MSDIELSKIEIVKKLTQNDYDKIGNDILIDGYNHLKYLQEEITFIRNELSKCKYRLSNSKSAKLSLTLTHQYEALMTLLDKCQTKQIILYMAGQKPLTNLLTNKERGTIEDTEQIEKIEPIQEDIDISDYKKYED